MRDRNDNSVDDNIEGLAFLAGLAHLQGQRQGQQEQARQTEEIRRLRQVAEHEAQVRRLEEKRLSSLPQCPLCGGRIEAQFRKCKHCRSNLSWIDGYPCEVGKEDELRDFFSRKRQSEVAKKEKLLRACDALQLELADITIGLVNECPRCSTLRPGSYEHTKLLRHGNEDVYVANSTYLRTAAHEYADWIRIQGCCRSCYARRRSGFFRRCALSIFTFFTFLVLLVLYLSR